MVFRTLIALTLLMFWLFAGQVRAQSPSHAPAAAEHPIVSLWLDPRALPASADAAAESKVFEQTLARTVELFLPLSPESSAAIRRAAAAFADRKPVLLTVDRFEAGHPVVEFISGAAEPGAIAAGAAHRRWANAQRGADVGAPCLEVFVDVDALRIEFLDSFSDGRAGRVIHALGVPNARSLMLHGRLVPPEKVPLIDPALPVAPAARRLGEYAAAKGPPLVRLDVSWNSRADERSTIRGMNIAAGHWPVAQLKLGPPDAPFLCMFRMNARAWLGKALMIRAAWLEPESGAAFEQSCATWIRGHRPPVDRIAGATHSWLIVHPSDRSPRWLIAQMPVRAENTSPDPIVREIDHLIRTRFDDRVEVIPSGGSRFAAPANWPISIIGWNPAPRPPRPSVQFDFDLRGGE